MKDDFEVTFVVELAPREVWLIFNAFSGIILGAILLSSPILLG